MDSIAAEHTMLLPSTPMPIMSDESRKFRRTFDTVMMLDAGEERTAAPLALMHTSDWFKSKVEAMRAESIVEYVLYTRLLKHPECPVQVQRVSRNGGGYLTRVTFGCRKFDWCFPRFEEEKKEELQRKTREVADLWTDTLDATVTVSMNAQSRQPCEYVMNLRPRALEISAYKIVSTLCDKFEDLKGMEYLSFNLWTGSTYLDIDIFVTFGLPSAQGVKCVLSGSFSVPSSLVNDLKHNDGDGNGGSVVVNGEETRRNHCTIDNPECKWSKVVLHTPWSELNEVDVVADTPKPAVKPVSYTLDLNCDVRPPRVKRMCVRS